MNIAEIAVIVFGLVLGYWAVGKLFFPSKSASRPPVAPLAWHQVLQVSPQATPEQIREAYFKLISKYHPDQIEAVGGQLQDAAAVKASEITNAYRAGLQAHGLDA
jgi:DnaJ-domain-containing protein 1